MPNLFTNDDLENIGAAMRPLLMKDVSLSVVCCGWDVLTDAVCF